MHRVVLVGATKGEEARGDGMGRMSTDLRPVEEAGKHGASLAEVPINSLQTTPHHTAPHRTGSSSSHNNQSSDGTPSRGRNQEMGDLLAQ